MKKALFTLLLVAAACSVALAQNNGSRVIVTTDTTACQSFVWSVNGQTYNHDTIETYLNATNDTLFVLSLTIAQPVTVPAVITSDRCSYSWRGTTYTVTGQYADTVATPWGCDSVFTLDLTLASTEVDSSVASACGEYIWNGDTLTTSGLYGDTLTNDGCTHINLLNLSILSQLDRFDTVENCGQYAWFDTAYSQDGNYTYLYQDTTGLCDTLFHLNLSIVMNEIATVYDSACNSRTWRGTVYNQTGVYHDYDTNNTTGCVTMRTLDLRIKPFRTPVKDTSMIGCNSLRFTVSSIRGSTTKVFTRTTDFDTSISSLNWALCYDSTIHLHATVKYSSSSDTLAVACDSFYWDRTKKIYSTTDSVKYTLNDTNAVGCDSILKLRLTVKKSPVISAINGEWNLAEGETARLYPTATEGSTYRWTLTPNVSSNMDGDTLVIPNVQGNIDVALQATLTYNDINFSCHDTSWITIVTYVGIDNAASANVRLYPNPTVGQLNIESAEAIREVSIFNTLGQQVLNVTNLGEKNLINLSTLSRGTYTMRILMASGESVVRKFVITK